MSLRVWLPLNGDLRNNGLDKLINASVQSGCSVSSDGKIGKCYKNTGTTAAVATPISFSADKFSLCAWVRIDSRHSGWCRSVGLSGNGTYMGLCCEHTNGSSLGFHYYKTIDGTNTSVFDIYPLNSEEGIWIHFCMIYDGIKYYIYKNGSLLTSANANKQNIKAEMTTLYLFGGINGRYSLSSLNDVRLYDHALSAKEVKELSKGLVCHYKLDGNGSGDNILAGTSNTEVQYEYPESSYKDRWSKKTSIIPTASQYTLSFYAKSTVNGDKVRAHFYSPNTTTKAETNQGVTSTSSDGNIDFTLSTKWERYWVVWTQTAADATKSVIFPRMFSQANGQATGTGTVSIKCVKLEEGNVATAWKPNSSDSSYSSFDNTIYDSSGYNNHAEKYAYDATGAIEVSSNTPRNLLSTYVNSENNTTNTASGTVFLYGNCGLVTPNYLTVAFWCKPIAGYSSQAGQGQFCTTIGDIGMNACSDYSTTAMHNRDSYIDMCTSTSVHKTVNIAFTANEWHHYAIVYDGRYGRVYKDGVQTSTLDMGSDLSLASFKAIVIGYSHAGGVYRSNKSYYSDFRVYSTALNENDIKELYQAPISILNNGSIFTQGEYVEV